jgi:K+-sensing histidine kinase KdpD
MTTAIQASLHASAQRTDQDKILDQARQLQENETLSMVLDAIPQYVAILDENRQIVAANSRFVGDFTSGQMDEIMGVRPGELVGCKFSCNSSGGCGTTEACRNCGAVNTILSAQSGTPANNDCQITSIKTNQSLDLNISASPVQINGRSLTFITVRDVANEKRLQVLERTFFHDVMNSAGGAMGIAEALDEAEDMDEVREFTPLLVSVTQQLVGEIQSQRDMIAAEQGDLKVNAEDIGTLHILLEVMSTYSSHKVAMGKHLVVDPETTDRLIHTSKPLLHRILGNMVKNALEATAPGATVHLGCKFEDDEFHFWVNNPDVMPRAIQLQVFNRSFSTKGAGRGIGTYSIKLLGEKYLGGRVYFESTEEEGTTFGIYFPAFAAH